QAIDSSDGQPRYVAKVYDLYLKGELLDVHAYGKDGHVYLPVMAIAKAAGIRTEWSPNWKRFTTTFGKAPGLKRGKYIYIDASDAPALFRLTGHLDEKHNFILE
ncbi:MAG: L,D-transpeptidase, partial [Dialister sp.]|nr:L,D-transpeptidase [Dialister sp.]